MKSCKLNIKLLPLTFSNRKYSGSSDESLYSINKTDILKINISKIILKESMCLNWTNFKICILLLAYIHNLFDTMSLYFMPLWSIPLKFINQYFTSSNCNKSVPKESLKNTTIIRLLYTKFKETVLKNLKLHFTLNKYNDWMSNAFSREKIFSIIKGPNIWYWEISKSKVQDISKKVLRNQFQSICLFWKYVF